MKAIRNTLSNCNSSKQLDLACSQRMSKLARYLRSHGISMNQADVHPKENRITNLAWGLVSAGAGAAALGLCITLFDTKATALEKLSAYGSYLQGAVGSLWALAGLLFIYVTFLAQKRQLQQQTDELEEQQEQFDIQRQESQRQYESIERQNFETAFFHLLNFHNQVTENLRHVRIIAHPSQGLTQTVEGRECFEYWYNGVRATLEQIAGSSLPAKQDPQIVSQAYCDYYESLSQQNLGHYFRTLYHVFKFVKATDMPSDVQRRYASIARAQLSSLELSLLFYNCLTPYGTKFKPLIEEFGLLEHLDKKTLFDASHEKFFAKTAYV